MDNSHEIQRNRNTLFIETLNKSAISFSNVLRRGYTSVYSRIVDTFDVVLRFMAWLPVGVTGDGLLAVLG